ncbi:hypothetical protein X798_05285, partial [Onchocerca flexuosa]
MESIPIISRDCINFEISINVIELKVGKDFDRQERHTIIGICHCLLIIEM